MREPCVLIVESDNDQRRRMSAWLEGQGYDVMFCAGPGEPDYICLSEHGILCPLADAADIVVLNLRLRSDNMRMGTTGRQILRYYYELGRKIVALVGEEDSAHPLPDDRVSILHQPIDRESFLAAIAGFARLVDIERSAPTGNDASG